MTITKSGSLASFYTMNKAPIKHLKVYFSPKQTGSGDPSPENIRPIEGWKDLDLYTSGKNIFDKSTGIVLEDSNLRVARSRNQGAPFYFKQGLNYTISVNGSTKRVSEIGVQTPYIGKYIKYSYSGYINYTPTEDIEAALNAFWVDGRPEDATDYQIEFGNEVTPFEAYHGNTYNIYFPSRTKNLLDKTHVLNAYLYTLENGYHKIFSYDMTRTVWMPCKPNTTYTCHKFSGGGRFVIGTSTREPVVGMDNLIKLPVREGDTNDLRVVTTGSDAKYLVMYVWKENEDTNITEQQMLDSIMVEEGDVTPSTYEPFDGMIYGGYLDLITGELVETNKKLILDGSSDENWWAYDTYDQYKGFALDNSGLKSGARQIGYANWLPVTSTATANNLECWLGVNNTRIYCASTASLVSTYNTSAWRAYLNENPLEIVIPLATPITYQLTPQQLQTFIGRNNIWSNADRVEVEYDLAETNEELYKRRNIILNSTPHIESTSSTLANFNTDLIAPLKECKINFSPVQEGSGDPSPENVRNIVGFTEINTYKASKNLLNPAYYSFSSTYESRGITFTHDGNGIITMNGTSDGEKSAQVTFSWTQPCDCDYYFCGNTSFGSSVGDVYIWDLTTNARPTQWDGITACNSSNVGLQEVKLLAGHRIQLCVRVYYINTTTLVNATAKPVLVHKTCTDRTFEPYNGTTIPITFPAVGKNLFKFNNTGRTNNGITYTVDGSKVIIDGEASNDSWLSNSTSITALDLIYLPAGTYTFSASGPSGVMFRFYDGPGSSYDLYNGDTHTFTTSGTQGIKLNIKVANGTEVDNEELYVQVESGSSATTYEPYNNTIYGGYVDLISGEIVATSKKYIINGTSRTIANYGNASYNGTEATNRAILLDEDEKTSVFEMNATRALSCFCESLKTATKGIWNTPNDYIWNFCIYNYRQLHISFDNAAVGITSDMDWTPRTNAIKTWLNANPLTFVLPLYTPIHYQLTPQQLTALKGVNNIWSNANGPISVQYWTY